MKISRVLTYFMVAAVFAFAIFATTIAPPAAQARVFISVGIAPPVIPVYEQPYAPGYGYIWTPGYWAWGEDAYYWVDGAWVLPPYVGALWTPGYWGYGEDAYSWNAGYWGRNIGYYGGINYGFGYFGSGFYGGCWRGDRFFYNGAYNRLGFHDHDDFVYTQRVNGFDGRPGGNAFDRHQDGLNRGDRGRDLNRGATVNGNNFSNRDNNRGNNGADRGMQQTNYRNGFNATGTRPDFNGGARQQYNGGEAATRSFNNGNSVAQSRGSFTPGSPLAQGRGNYAAPQPRSFGGGQSAAPQPRSPGGGGGFQGGGHGNFGGGGGGFQGGGGHAGFSSGGGGSRGGGGGHR